MKALKRIATLFACSAMFLAPQTLADDKKPAAAATDAAKAAAAHAMPDEKAMAEAMEKMAKLGPNHELLKGMIGDWDYTMSWWMDPSQPAQTSKGTAKHVSMMEGRYVHSDHQGTMAMPDPANPGKSVDKPFHGAGVTGYDNMKQKFVSVWMDNMSTGMFMTEGTYDAAAKTFTYHGDMDDPMMSGSKVHVRYTIKMTDNDHHDFTWYETRGGQEMKTMEIKYARKK
ncbi:MAG: DUF1579 domain-containing protein [Phycisphaerae bacterium]|nr:DUF1579 domain-containing protein [Phycisphaerae bacterium]